MIELDTTALVLRRNWYVPAAFWLLALGSLVLAKVSWELAPFGWLGIFFGLAIGVVVAVRDGFPLRRPIRLSATREALALGDVNVPTEAIVEAKLVPRPGPVDRNTLVELVLRDRKKVRLLTSQPSAVRLLGVIGERRRSFVLVIPFWKRLLATSLVIGLPWMLFVLSTNPDVALAIIMFPIGILPFCALLAWMPLGLLRGKLVVGADGLTTRWFKRDRFVPFRDVQEVQSKGSFVSGTLDTIVGLRSGGRLRLRALESPNTESERNAEGRALLAHVVDAFQKSAGPVGTSVDVRALVSRGTRTAREWLASLDGLVRGGAVRYRVAAVAPELLLDVVHDPNGAVDARAGAAAALVRTGDEASRTKVRVAADACADPRLRVALLAIAEASDDEAVEHALARVVE